MAAEMLSVGKGKWRARERNLHFLPQLSIQPLVGHWLPVLREAPYQAVGKQRWKNGSCPHGPVLCDLKQMKLSLIHMAKYEVTESDDLLGILSVFIALSFLVFF